MKLSLLSCLQAVQNISASKIYFLIKQSFKAAQDASIVQGKSIEGSGVATKIPTQFPITSKVKKHRKPMKHALLIKFEWIVWDAGKCLKLKLSSAQAKMIGKGRGVRADRDEEENGGRKA